MNKVYETNKFYMKFFEMKDITDDYKSWFLDSEVTKYTCHGLFPYTNDKHNEMIKMITEWERTTTPNNIVFAVMVEYNKFPAPYIICHIGNVALHNINYTNRTAEFAGIFGEKKYWNKGIGTEATRFIFEYGFNKLNLNKIYLGTAENNMGMRKIATKLNMAKEGCLINHVYLNGKYENIINYGILKENFK